MRRREFLGVLSGGVAAWPLAAHAQQTKPRTVGFVGASTAAPIMTLVTTLVQRLRELGWIEGRTIAIEYRWAEGQFGRLPGFVAEFVRLGVDVIVAEGTVTVLAAKHATATIPIVFPIAGDPVGNKLVASLARPGGNVTGLSIQATDLAPKRLELLREIIPGINRLAVIANATSPNAGLEIGELRSAAAALGIDVSVHEIQRADDIASAFEMIKGRAESLYVPPDPLVYSNRIAINTLALRQKLPTMYAYRDYVQAAGLVSYGPNLSELFRRAAEHVDKILRGTKPADIPVEQPTKFDLIILTTAKALGLTVPPSILARADEKP